MTRRGRFAFRTFGIALVALVVLYLLVWLIMSLGGAKFALERGISSAMNGYLAVDDATYRPFGPLTAENLRIVLEVNGFQQRIITIDKLRAVPRLRWLPWGRMHFKSVKIEGLALDFEMMPDRRLNITKLFPEGNPDGDGNGFRVFPPDYLDIQGFRISVAPYTVSPIPFESIRATFKHVARTTTRGIATLKSELIGSATAFIDLNLGNGAYHVQFNTGTIVLDRHFMERLPIMPDEELIRMILPQGRFAVQVLAAGLGNGEELLEATLNLQGLDVHSLQFPIAIVGATGAISFDGRNLRVQNLSCFVPMSTVSAAVRVNAEMLEDDTIQVSMEMVDLELTERFLFFLPQTEELLDLISIDGLANMNAKVTHRPNWIMPRVNATMSFTGEIMPAEYPIPISEIRAVIRTDERGLLFLDDVTAIIGEGVTRSQLQIAGMLDPDGRSFNLLFSSDSFYITQDLLQQVPMIPQSVLDNIGLSGRMAVGGEAISSPEGTLIDARVSLDDFNVILLRYPEIALSNIRGVVTFTREQLVVDTLLAKFLTGDVLVQFAADTAEDNESFEGRVMLRNIDIGLLPRDWVEEEIAGLVDITLAFSADDTDPQALRALGEFSLRAGRIIELPLVVSIITFIDLRPPEPPVFTKATGRFRIDNGIVRIRRLEILSDQLILFASGNIAFDGRLNLRANLGVRQPLLEGLPLVGPLLGLVTGAIRSVLTTVIVTGTLDEPEIELEAARTLLLPLTAVLDIFDPGGRDRDVRLE